MIRGKVFEIWVFYYSWVEEWRVCVGGVDR